MPVRFIQCAAEDAVGIADDAVEALLDKGWPPESVALLTTYSWRSVQVEWQAAGQDAY